MGTDPCVLVEGPAWGDTQFLGDWLDCREAQRFPPEPAQKVAVEHGGSIDRTERQRGCQGWSLLARMAPRPQLAVPGREHLIGCTAVKGKSSRAGTFSYNFDLSGRESLLTRITESGVDALDESSVEQRAGATASAFGSLIRRRRRELKIRQAQLALATGVGRRFLVDLESGKPTCQLGRSLLVADALGLRPADILASDTPAHDTGAELPDLTEEEVQEPDGHSPSIL